MLRGGAGVRANRQLKGRVRARSLPNEGVRSPDWNDQSNDDASLPTGAR